MLNETIFDYPQQKGGSNVEVKIHDVVWSQATDRHSINLLKPCLSVASIFKQQITVPGRKGKVMKERPWRKYFIDRDNGLFLTGLLPRVKEFCGTINHNLHLTNLGNYERIAKEREPQLSGINFRDDQLRLIHEAIRHQRGLLVGPPAIGKTIIAMGLISCFPSSRVLFLCHSLDILHQTVDEMKRFGFEPSIISGSQRDLINSKRIVVANYQSFIKCDPEVYCDLFDLVLIDECHIATGQGSSYDLILKSLLSPIRVGLTATPPTANEEKIWLEGLIGPVVGEVSIQEGVELDLIEKPRLKIIRVPDNDKVKKLRRYQEIYKEGITRSRLRNRIILQTAKNFIEEGLTVLIFVIHLEHGYYLSDMAQKVFGLDIPFIYGDTEGSHRNRIKQALLRKEMPAVISSVIWREGVNIPNLDALIYAPGGKSERATMQSVGRVLRKAEGKEAAYVVDFLDTSSNYFIRHFGERMVLYSELGWI